MKTRMSIAFNKYTKFICKHNEENITVNEYERLIKLFISRYGQPEVNYKNQTTTYIWSYRS